MTRRSTLRPSGAMVRFRMGFCLVATLVTLNSCGGSPTATGSTAANGAPAQASTPSSAATSSAAAGTVRKVNANTASQAELKQALQDAGVPNADRWVREVMEYRPYPTTDPSIGKLRGELAKYNPGPGVVDKIISALSL